MSPPEKIGSSMPMERGSPISSPSTIPSRAALALPLILTGVFLVFGFFSPARTNPRLAWTFGGVAAFLLCWQAALFLWPGRKVSSFAWEFVAMRSHYMQALAQASVFVYWGWYWRNVYAEATLILAQVAFLYILDALVTWSRGQTWRVGFGPWPIILSTNLFMWFRDDWFVFQFLMIALGVLGKQFIRWRREGRLTHIFNPSALGLTVVSLVLIFTGTSGYTWGEQIALTQGHPPYLFTEIFLCGLILQYFFSVTLLTFSAVAALVLINFAYLSATGVYLFIDSNIPIAVFLGLHLLMTDPATSPRSSLGRAVFGGLYGAGVCAAFLILDATGVPSFYDKLVLVPILNLLTPLLDRCAALGLAGTFGRWEIKTGPGRLNLVYMSCWMAMFLVMVKTGYVQARHPGETIAFWAKAAEEHRVHAMKYLRRYLNDFDKQNLNDSAVPVGLVGAAGQRSRGQALGILCNEVGAIYALGKLVPPDHAKASRLFAEACDLGNLEGCANLAVEYLKGQAETEADGQQALSRLENASAGMTNARSFFILGYSYDVGKGHAMDKTKARQFYEQAARLGDLEACQKLGRMQASGEGGPPDYAAAAVWLQRAADAQDGTSCLYLAKLYHNGDGVARDEQKALALLEKACGLGIQPACELLKAAKK